jgi:hypothetical protein
MPRHIKSNPLSNCIVTVFCGTFRHDSASPGGGPQARHRESMPCSDEKLA